MPKFQELWQPPAHRLSAADAKLLEEAKLIKQAMGSNDWGETLRLSKQALTNGEVEE